MHCKKIKAEANFKLVMAMNYVWFFASLKKQFKCSTAEKRKTIEIIMFSVKLPSPKELVRVLRLNKVNRKTCVIETHNQDE